MTQSGTVGTVYIVGAGPGDPGLITVKGLSCLRRADVVLYDRLIASELLLEAALEAELINVGKAPGRHSFPQAEINALLVAKAWEGKSIVRLKGGDPFVFGRGGEECQALADAGIPFEVVPGVSSAVAGPAYAGIPITHRDFASAFTVVAGQPCDPETESLDWAALARLGTLVFLMGVSKLPEIAARLVAHGRSPDTPVALIASATTSSQTVVVGTLADIAEKSNGLRPPATIVVGEVVRLHDKLKWFDPKQAGTELGEAGLRWLAGAGLFGVQTQMVLEER